MIIFWGKISQNYLSSLHKLTTFAAEKVTLICYEHEDEENSTDGCSLDDGYDGRQGAEDTDG